ncbi:MAG: hypothetical protein HY538_00055 [Deltaproteobacteria bacterium]|nr:hypothetical protein [Deltaproteobacteria bacterium]
MGLQSGKKKGAFIVGIIVSIIVLSYSLSEAGVTYLHSDPLNSPLIETNEVGWVVGVQSFTPFGEGGEGYVGQEYDSSADLQSNHARYYDPVLSQFVSVDPVQGNLPYAYANNSPIVFIDPNGRDPEEPGVSSIDVDINDWFLTPAMREKVESFILENHRWPDDEEFSQMKDFHALAQTLVGLLAVWQVSKATKAFGMSRKLQAADIQRIRDVFREVGTLAETIRRTGFSEGTVRQYIRSAGMKANRVGRYPSITNEEALSLREKYAELQSVSAVAKKTGRSPVTVWGCVIGKIGPAFSEEKISAIQAAYAELKDINEAARRVGLPPKAVRLHVEDAGKGVGRKTYEDFDEWDL